MLKHLSHARVIGAWFVVFAIATIGSLAAGASAVPSTWTLLLMISLMPPALAMMIWRGAPSPAAAEVLPSARHLGGR